MTFFKLFFGSKDTEVSSVYTELSTSRKFSIEFNREEVMLTKYENQILNRR